MEMIKQIEESAKQYIKELSLGHLSLESNFDYQAVKGEINDAFKAGWKTNPNQYSEEDIIEFCFRNRLSFQFTKRETIKEMLTEFKKTKNGI